MLGVQQEEGLLLGLVLDHCRILYWNYHQFHCHLPRNVTLTSQFLILENLPYRYSNLTISHPQK